MDKTNDKIIQDSNDSIKKLQSEADRRESKKQESSSHTTKVNDENEVRDPKIPDVKSSVISNPPSTGSGVSPVRERQVLWMIDSNVVEGDKRTTCGAVKSELGILKVPHTVLS
ncbi:hypothetical protein ACOSQ3_023663 [Xanthoceras sorbifolium]